MHVYCITNLVNGKIYIGQTTKNSVERYLLEDTWRANSGNNSKPLLYRAYRKYGKEGFSITSLIRPISKPQMDEMEKFFIRTLESRNRAIGYNICAGGQGTSRPCSQQTKDRISAATKGKIVSLESREKMRKSQSGKRRGPLSKEHKAKISVANKGRVPSPKAIQNSRLTRLGKKTGPRPESVKQKISATKRLRALEKTLKMISISEKGTQDLCLKKQ